MADANDRAQFWIDRYISHLATTSAQATLSAYTFDLQQAQGYALDTGLPAIPEWSSEHADRWLQWLREEQGYRPGTVARRQHAMRSFHYFLIDEGNRTDIAVQTPSFRRQRRPRTLEADELYRIFMQRTPVGKRYGCLLELMYATGARSTEIVALQLGDVQVVGQSKAAITLSRRMKRQRTVPLYRAATVRLVEYLKKERPAEVRRTGARSIALFPGKRDDGYLTRQAVNAALDDIAVRAEVDKDGLSPGTLRHTFARRLIVSGLPFRKVKYLLGSHHYQKKLYGDDVEDYAEVTARQAVETLGDWRYQQSATGEIVY